MGLFSRRDDSHEPSYSRKWIAQNGTSSRKTKLAVAIVKRLADSTVGTASAWGQLLDGISLNEARAIASTVVAQDRSLARHVARDVTLLFESFGGLAANREAALEAMGLAGGSAAADRAGQAASDALAVARTIQVRHEGREPQPPDLAVYAALFEDASTAGHERALDIAAWSGTVTARLRTQGHIQGSDIPVFSRSAAYVAEMEGKGWYPNPVNAGSTSNGEAQFERWWDGRDWTDRVRIRDGRSWNEHHLSLLTVPSN